MPFDARTAKLLQPGEHIILQEQPGLRLVATVARRSWIYRFKSPIDGGMRQVKLGEWPGMSHPAAAVLWEKLRNDRAEGVDPALGKRVARRRVLEQAARDAEGVYTVLHLVEDYLSGHIDLHRKPKGAKEVRRLLKGAIEKIADRPAAGLQRSEAFKLLKDMEPTPVLAAQARQELGAAWDYALDAGKLPESTSNWWRQILRGKLRSKGKKIAGEHVGTDKRVLSPAEVGTLINWLPNFSKLVADALVLYLWTGTRGAEIVGMERGELAVEGDGVLWWTIPKRRTKNARHDGATDLRVPLRGRAEAVVRRRMGLQSRFLFPALDGESGVEQKVVQGAVHYHQPYSKTRSKLEQRPRLPVTHWSPHDLRRTVRTMLASMGCPAEVAESVLGHMLAGVVGVYNRHGYDAERLDWLTRLDARLEELARLHPL